MNVIDIAEALRDCLCGFISDTPGGPVCRCFLYPSPEIPFDVCTKDANGNGQAAVGLVRTFLTREFPVPVDSRDLRCDYYLAAEFVLSVVRCAPTITSGGKLPSPEALDIATALVAADANAMRCAATCCLEGTRQFQFQGWEAYPISGGCMGGQLTIVVQTDDVVCFQGSS